MSATRSSDGSSQARLREMFDRMVLQKDASVISEYYDPEFVLSSNGKEQDYAAFVAGHERVYATEIAYTVESDEDAWVEIGDRLAGRMWITTTNPGQPSTRIEVVLIARFNGSRLRQLWELTWPDWSRLEAFGRYDIVGP